MARPFGVQLTKVEPFDADLLPGEDLEEDEDELAQAFALEIEAVDGDDYGETALMKAHGRNTICLKKDPAY